MYIPFATIDVSKFKVDLRNVIVLDATRTSDAVFKRNTSVLDSVSLQKCIDLFMLRM